MKVLLISLLFIIPVISEAQKKIKDAIVLSTNDTVNINDDILLKKASAKDGIFDFVRTRSDYSVNFQYENTRQSILYFKEIDNICYAYTFSFVIDLEKALKNGEIQLIAKKKVEAKPIITGKSESINKKEKTKYTTQIVEKSKVRKIFAYPIDNLLNLDINGGISMQMLEDNPNLLCMTNMRYCLRKYHHIRRNGRYFIASGSVLLIGSPFIKNTTAQLVVLGVGGGLGVTGGVLYLVAEKWMKYSTIKPVIENDRVGLSITF